MRSQLADVLIWPREEDVQGIILQVDERSSRRPHVRPAIHRSISGGVWRAITTSSIDFDDGTAFDTYYKGDTSATRCELEDKGSGGIWTNVWEKDSPLRSQIGIQHSVDKEIVMKTQRHKPVVHRSLSGRARRVTTKSNGRFDDGTIVDT
jgi:hypothetical protein